MTQATTQPITEPTQSPVSRTAEPTVATKVVIHKGGNHDQLCIETAPIPEPAPGEVLIRVRAAGVNYADTTVRLGLYESAKELVGWPITPGFEIAGVVQALGEGVEEFSIGDRVVGCTLFGGYASHIAVRKEYLFTIPEHLSFEEAASIPTVFLTAWFAVHELAHPRPGNIALVHSVAGGVGSSLARVLKMGGVEVIGTVGSAHKVEAAKSFGATHVIDRSTQDLWEEVERIAPNGVDVIFDASGVETLKPGYEHLRPAGKLVIFGFAGMMSRGSGSVNWLKLASQFFRIPKFHPMKMTQQSKSVMAFNLSYLFDRLDLFDVARKDIQGWLERREIEPPPITTFALTDVAKAHEAIESGSTVGKLILLPD